jgi:hypothetical protein
MPRPDHPTARDGQSDIPTSCQTAAGCIIDAPSRRRDLAVRAARPGRWARPARKICAAQLPSTVMQSPSITARVLWWSSAVPSKAALYFQIYTSVGRYSDVSVAGCGFSYEA